MKILTFICTACILFACQNPSQKKSPLQQVNNNNAHYDSLATQVKMEYLHAWNGYEKYAMGFDAVGGVSGIPRNWYKESLLITPIDALDGMIIMGLSDQADSLIEYLDENISWDKDVMVSLFEINIRCLGGLLASYELSGDKRLLGKAENLGRRFLPAFNSPTGMPYRFVNLKTGEKSGEISNPAEIGTLVIEFGTLSRFTGDSTFYKLAMNALEELYKRRSDIGLVGDAINVETGEWVSTSSHVGACIDSYYEYLLKAWLLFGDEDYKTRWETHKKAVNQYCLMKNKNGLWYGHVDMNTGVMTVPVFGALDAFFPAMLVLNGDLETAEKVHGTWYTIWDRFGLEPEGYNFESGEIPEGSAYYYLRPEIIESCYYLYHYTKDQKYREMAEKIFSDLLRYCRTEIGYTIVKDVVTKEKGDLMESFLFGETLKYLYLIFSSDTLINPDNVVFTTEAHPIKRVTR